MNDHSNMKYVDKADFIENVIYSVRTEHNLEWDDIHDVRELAVYLAEMLFEKEQEADILWLKTSENLDKLQDHYFYLVTHPDFGTPLKAKYHNDMGGYFEFPYYPVDMEFVDPIFGECKCKYFMELPEMPDDYEEVDSID